MKHWLILMALVVLAACSKPQKTPYLTLKPDTLLTGKAELYYLSNEYTLFDTAVQSEENSSLNFRKDSVPEGIYELRINNIQVAPLIINSSMPFSIKGNFGKDLSLLNITNNDETKALWQAQLMTQKLSDEIRHVANNLPDSLPENVFFNHRDSLYEVVNNLIEATRKKVDKLNRNHPKSLLPLLLVKLQAGNHLIYHPENNSEDYYEVCNHLKTRYPNYVPVKKFANQIDSLMNWNVFNAITKEGRKLPSLKITDAWGEIKTIDSLNNQPTLFVIWKSSDLASREITKKLMRWSWSYRNKGLQLCMIALDDNRDEWLKAIKEDRLTVQHLSDLKGKQSPILNQLGLSSFPCLLLVNQEKIILKRTTELEMLSVSLEEIIKN